MKRQERQQKYHLNRRAVLMMGLQALGLSVLATRLAYLQVIKKKSQKYLSKNTFLRLELIAPSRGRIYDSQKNLIATNRRVFRVTILNRGLKNVHGTLNTIASIIPLSYRNIDTIIERSQSVRMYTRILVKDDLTWEDISKLSLHKAHLPDMEISDGESRFYPSRDIFAHTLGYVGNISSRDLIKGDALLDMPGFQSGKIGLEKGYDKILRGIAGFKKIQAKDDGITIRNIEYVKPKSGRDLSLTVNGALQSYIINILRSYRSGSVVVIDTVTGSIKSMVSKPSFDPNMFVNGISRANWDALRKNVDKPLLNRSLQGLYAPGSTFKVLVALSALNIGVTKDFVVNCRGYVDIGKHRFYCWKRGGHGRLDMLGSIRASCDVYYYVLSLRVGVENMAKTSRMFGFGQTHALGVPFQESGTVPDKMWKKRHYGRKWLLGESVITAIGQGYLLTTPLQLALATARLASGKAIVPFVCKYGVNGTLRNRSPSPLAINEKYLNLVREGMRQVVNAPGGTGFKARLNTWQIAGKTGTSQVRNISKEERKTGVISNRYLPRKYRDHAIFVGYGPFDNPRYAISCVIDHGGGGASIAAPIVKHVFLKIIALTKKTNTI